MRGEVLTGLAGSRASGDIIRLDLGQLVRQNRSFYFVIVCSGKLFITKTINTSTSSLKIIYTDTSSQSWHSNNTNSSNDLELNINISREMSESIQTSLDQFYPRKIHVMVQQVLYLRPVRQQESVKVHKNRTMQKQQRN